MYNVMIVDDSEVIRMGIKRMKLWNTNFRIVAEAENGEDALEKLRRCSVDLLLLDIQMPIINGIELLKIVKEESLAKEVVFISDFSCFEYARQGILLGAFDFLAKPVDMDSMGDLLIRVRNKLEKTDALQKVKDTQFDIIVDAFIGGGDCAISMAEKAFDYKIASHSFENPVLQICKVYREITDKVIDKNRWLNKFISVKINSELYGADDYECCKELCISKLKELYKLIQFAMVPREDNHIVRKTIEYILNNIDNDINLNHISESLYVNRTYLSEIFKNKTSRSISDHIAFLKVERAKYLMSYENLKIYEVAYKLSYKDGQCLSKVFKRITGETPSEYRIKVIESRQ